MLAVLSCLASQESVCKEVAGSHCHFWAPCLQCYLLCQQGRCMQTKGQQLPLWDTMCKNSCSKTICIIDIIVTTYAALVQSRIKCLADCFVFYFTTFLADLVKYTILAVPLAVPARKGMQTKGQQLPLWSAMLLVLLIRVHGWNMSKLKEGSETAPLECHASFIAFLC